MSALEEVKRQDGATVAAIVASRAGSAGGWEAQPDSIAAADPNAAHSSQTGPAS